MIKEILEEIKKREDEGWKVRALLGGTDDHRLPLSCASWAYEWVRRAKARPLDGQVTVVLTL